MVVRKGMPLTMAGVAVGVVAALPLVEDLTFDVGVIESPASACCVPTRRAARIDPALAVREDQATGREPGLGPRDA